MVIGKIKPAATIVAQFAGNVEVAAIQHEGKIYLPVMAIGEFATKESAPVKSAPEKPASAPAKEENEAEEKSSKSYTEDELMEMSTKDLVKLCKEEFGINPDDYDGKNTNKKLRLLILDAQENDGAEDDDDDEDDEEEEAPKKSSKKNGKKSKDEEPEEDEDDDDEDGDETVQKISDILEDFDSGKKNKKKTIATIVALSDDADEDAVAELVEKFESDEEADIDDLASEIAKVLTAPKKSAKKRGGKKAKEELVEPSDLEVGDRVSVWWDDDNQEWYDGTVKSKKKNKVVIAYDDDTEEAIDPEIHTKIKKLAK